jgi:hypothetical protein
MYLTSPTEGGVGGPLPINLATALAAIGGACIVDLIRRAMRRRGSGSRAGRDCQLRILVATPIAQAAVASVPNGHRAPRWTPG